MLALNLVSLAIAGVPVAIALFFVYDVVRRYRDSTGTLKDRLMAAGRGSVTMVWSKFLIIIAAVVANLDGIADMAGQPQVKDYLNQAISNPKTLAWVMLGISLVTMFARARTLP